jgi:hypothetical protein
VRLGERTPQSKTPWGRRRPPVVVFASHGRRLTNTYPATPKTTGIIINIPHTVLIIVFSVPLLAHVVVVALHPAARAGMAPGSDRLTAEPPLRSTPCAVVASPPRLRSVRCIS